ncbi:hypothetical protein JCM16303_002914 [Sporobolomyces ruberrimus]
MSDPSIAVASLGLFILDTFEWRSAEPADDPADSNPSTSPAAASTTLLKRDEGVIGGGGTYAMIGARIWLRPNRIGILVDRGNDWDSRVEAKLNEFGKDMWIYRDKEGETTKALNLYTGEHRDFKYLTPRTRLEPQDLPRQFHTSRYLHFVCSPTRALVIHSQLSSTWQPALVYEPIPDRCIPEELDALRRILPHVAIFSPNHEEAASFYGISATEINKRGQSGIEEVAKRFFEEGAKDVVIIRSGALGAYALRKGEDKGFWVPAFYAYDDAEAQKKVKDVTGAGNSFLGGLMAGLVLHPDDLRSAVEHAAVSASFIIEQFGLPSVANSKEGDRELWNGSSPIERLDELRSRRLD